MSFLADLHVHSKYSRATARNLDLEHLYTAAQLKGITLVATGDFTHPAWLSEIKDKLRPDEKGLFSIQPSLAKDLDQSIPHRCRRDVRFMLVSEISNIYKKNGKTRKNHNLVFLPDLASVDAFNARLDQIGNISSDGRPILGLDARDLLEILLDTCDDGLLVPAHIWTPWFSLFGSKSGFDSIRECFADLRDRIVAVETGLSSDPSMNWRFKDLDGMTLISNSDAHSPMKLGREANIFECPLSYEGVKTALSSGDGNGFLGTLEFYAEEGKYHLDGHRKCGVRCWPSESLQRNGICPVCNKPMTLGVLHRVEVLAQRPEGGKPRRRQPFYHMIPLHDVLSELLEVGPASKKVNHAYQTLLQTLGSELDILQKMPLHRLTRDAMPLLPEAIKRVREGNIQVLPGYDGEFGKVNIFKPGEKQRLTGQHALFPIPSSDAPQKGDGGAHATLNHKNERSTPAKAKSANILGGLNALQKKAVLYKEGPMIVVAGPGTGKTRTITHRIAHLIKTAEAQSAQILALTFTNKAAEALLSRLQRLIDAPDANPSASTFHRFCLQVLCERNADRPFYLIDDNDRQYLIREALRITGIDGTDLRTNCRRYEAAIVKVKQELIQPQDMAFKGSKKETRSLVTVFNTYQRLLSIQHLNDYEDLIRKTVIALEAEADFRIALQARYRYIFVDEYQDINYAQYRLIRLMSPPGKNLCVIGDPNQSIYGFRGSDVRYFNRFKADYPDAAEIKLRVNYRSTQTILDASRAVARGPKVDVAADRIQATRSGPETIGLMESSDERNEAIAIGKWIEFLVGGIGFHSIDFGKTDAGGQSLDCGFGDIAILYRTARQASIFLDVFEQAGIPCQVAAKPASRRAKRSLSLISLLKFVSGIACWIDFERVVALSGVGIGPRAMALWKNWVFHNQYSLQTAFKQMQRFPIKNMQARTQLKLNEVVDRLTRTRAALRKRPVDEQIESLRRRFFIGENRVRPPAENDVIDVLQHRSQSYGKRLDPFLRDLCLQMDADFYDHRIQNVTMMTMHASKGLEFPVVFVAGCENGLIPFSNADGRATDIEEERRLLYVAMTRAEHKVFLSFAKQRTIFGKKMGRAISEFIADIPEGLKREEPIEMKTKTRRRHTQMPLFSL